MYARTDKGAIVALIPKAGMQSLRDAIKQKGDLTLDEVRDEPVRVVFLRDPVARLASAYRFFKTLYERLGYVPSVNAPQPEHVANWDAFMEYVRAYPSDPHWRPQIETVREFAPTAIHRLESIDQHWFTYQDWPPVSHLNRSWPYEVGEIPPDIMARYAEENALWRGL